MQETKTSTFSNGLLWFGAAVSIAEILTGTLIAPLGFFKGATAILIGHLIGCTLLYFAGLIGAQTEKSAMETVKMSFGQKGALFFSWLNIFQLIGWTAIMIVNGAAAANFIAVLGGNWVWSLIIGGLISVWILIGIKNLGKVNLLAGGGLFLLTIVMSIVVFKGSTAPTISGGLSFGAAVELSIAMPLSWLPLISDYTRLAKKKKAATFVSAATYFFASCWMYMIGLGAALFTGESDISKIMVSAGLGISGLLIVIFSTVTTTFLDAYSAGVSAVTVSKKINEKWGAVTVCIIGTLLAIFTPILRLESFLYLIGSVFAPMIAIMIGDYFFVRKDYSNLAFDIGNFLIWMIGFILYRLFLRIDTPIGNTLPVMIIVFILCIIRSKILGGKKNV